MILPVMSITIRFLKPVQILVRQSFADPLIPLKLEEDVNYCSQCMNCEELMIQQKPVGCVTFNRYYTDLFLEVRKSMGKLAELHT
jgi:hypothetical protein